MVKAVLPEFPEGRKTTIRAMMFVGAAVAVTLALVLVIADEAAGPGLNGPIAAVLLVLAVVVAGLGLKDPFQRWRIKQGFDLVCEQAAVPFFLTKADSTLISSNMAARLYGNATGAGTPEFGEAPVGMLARELLRWSPKAEEIVYRLSRVASGDWSTPDITGGADPCTIAVRRLDAGRLLWRIEAPGTLKPLSANDEAYKIAELGLNGQYRSQTRAFAALSAEMREAVANAVPPAADKGESFVEVTTRSGEAASVGIATNQAGFARIFLVERQDGRNETLSDLLEDLPVALVRMKSSGGIVSANAAARKLLGSKAKPGAALETLVEGFGRPVEAQVRDAAAGRGAGRTEQARGRVEGREVFLQIALTQAPDDQRGELLAVLSDATELKTLEQQFVQSQKMQAVGQMAGGVAHDFNNLLTAIIGHCDLLMLRTDQAEPAFADLAQIKQNANRAAALVRQLLAFSRKQTLKPKPASLSDTLNELSHLLNRLLGERVRIELDHAFDLWPVWIDERQFEQVVVNLAVNARDAMPDGGSVTVRCWNRVLTETWRRDRAIVPPGDYVCIKVADTGTGMDEETMNKVFEPFFTTKRQGEGTGLGLSTAYGIIKQMDGFIFVDSTLGAGTVFTILLPRMQDVVIDEPVAAPKGVRDLTGSGAILLVEDEAPVRAFAARALKLRGYDVVEADCAEAALTILEDEDMAVDLMISDVVMPGMDGPTWVRAARMARPDVGVIFISGYAEGVFRNGMEGLDNYSFLPKPFVLEELASAVKKALTEKNGASPVSGNEIRRAQ